MRPRGRGRCRKEPLEAGLAVRHSKVDQLGPDIREEIAGLREQGFTIDQILDHLRALAGAGRVGEGELPSRSGMGRYVQGLDRLAEKLTRSRTIAEALVRRFGDAPENRTARLNIELMHGVVTDLLLAVADAEGDAEEGEGRAVTLDPKSVAFMAKALNDLASASKSDADLQIKIRDDAEKRTREAAMKAVEKVAKASGGISADTMAQIKAGIFGIAT